MNNENMFSILMRNVADRIASVRNHKIILDADVALLYGVETKRINEAVRNNPDKFPSTYMFQLSKDEVEILRTKISSTNYSAKSRSLPYAFTEKGLYMLATILKSKTAINTTFEILAERVKNVHHATVSRKFETPPELLECIKGTWMPRMHST